MQGGSNDSSFSQSVMLNAYTDSHCSSGALGTLTGNATLASAGTATFSSVTYTKAEILYFQAASGTLLSTCYASTTVAPASAVKLVYSTEPSSAATAGVAFAQQPVLQALDSYSNLVTNYTATVSLGSYSDAACTTAATGILTSNSTLSGAGVATFSGVSFSNAGNLYLKGSSGGLASACSSVISVAPGPATQLVLASPLPSTAYKNGPISPTLTVQALDSNGNIATSYNSPITISPFGGTTCSNADSPSTLTGATVTAANGVAQFSALSYGGGFSQISLKAGDGNHTSACSGGISVLFPSISSLSPNGGPVAGGNALTISGANFFATPTVTVGGVACPVNAGWSSSQITCNVGPGTGGLADVVVTINGGQTSQIRGYMYGVIGGVRWVGAENLGGAVVASSSWIAANPSPSPVPAPGSSPGMLNTATGLASDGNYIYAADANNNRVHKYSALTGGYVGWIGKVGASTCGTAGTWTTGWCTNGTASTTGLTTAMSVTIDSTKTYLFVATKAQTVEEFNASTGAHIATFGTGVQSTADGSFNYPWGVTADGTFIYVADANNYRVSRWNISTATSAGWIGLIGSSPQGGASGCAGAAVNSVTPGWCTGGSATSGTINGAFGNLYGGIAYDSTSGNLFVADQSNGRVQIFNASSGAYSTSFPIPGTTAGITVGPNGNTLYAVSNPGQILRFGIQSGAPLGWFGYTGSAPSSGEAGCTGITPPALLTGWCNGGSPLGGTSGNQFNINTNSGSWPSGIAVDGSGNVYFADTNNNRIVNFNQFK